MNIAFHATKMNIALPLRNVRISIFDPGLAILAKVFMSSAPTAESIGG